MTSGGSRQEPRRSQRRSDTVDPHHARERALRILFQADARGLSPSKVLQGAIDDPDQRMILDTSVDEAVEIDGFTKVLVVGVEEHAAEVDELIARFARGWQIHRMPAVDRTILRLATYELANEPTSSAVVIDEAVEFAKQWSTDDSGRYVNGVLEAVRRHLSTAG